STSAVLSCPVLSCPAAPFSSDMHIPIFGLGMFSFGTLHIDLWLTIKLWPGDYGYRAAKKTCLESCSLLGVEYFDLYLMHWPESLQPGCSKRELRAETWRALEELYKEGVCQAIGMSNFLVHHREQLQEDCRVVPHINQVEYCHEKGIVFEGYGPLAKGQALSVAPTVCQIAEKHRRTPAQICICWSIQVVYILLTLIPFYHNCIIIIFFFSEWSYHNTKKNVHQKEQDTGKVSQKVIAPFLFNLEKKS
uniref:NADP-dependent oxidoreductase domain-containing protein n=1 Tax=Mastacembelus armatus TaxID=205130 RepID=A0A3Q3LVR6_9TELE